MARSDIIMESEVLQSPFSTFPFYTWLKTFSYLSTSLGRHVIHAIDRKGKGPCWGAFLREFNIPGEKASVVSQLTWSALGIRQCNISSLKKCYTA